MPIMPGVYGQQAAPSQPAGAQPPAMMPAGAVPGIGGGPMGGAPKPGGGGAYNGVINVKGRQLKVTNGVVEGSVDEPGKKILVSADGQIVMDNTGKVLGTIVNGALQPPTPQMVQKLKAMGIVKPSGQASAAPGAAAPATPSPVKAA